MCANFFWFVYRRAVTWLSVDFSRIPCRVLIHEGSVCDDANRAQTRRQLEIVVLGSRSRRLLQPVLTEGHFDVIDSRTRHLDSGYVL